MLRLKLFLDINTVAFTILIKFLFPVFIPHHDKLTNRVK
jgi:hypothetical protein